jgi:hypothetical protein
MSDEDYISNLPEHHLRGYVGVEDDVDDDVEEDGGDDDDDDDEGLVGVHDDDVYADEDAEADAENQEDEDAGEENDGGDDGDDGDDDDGDEGNALTQAAPQSLAQAEAGEGFASHHLFKTSIRVDPPLTADGKKSIAEAEKTLDEAKKEYDTMADKSQDLEFKFKASARRSRHAREGKGEAEDAYYIAAKNARKSARHAENLARESQQAAAKQAASDKFGEIISAGNKEASDKQKKPDGPAAKTGPTKAAAQTEAKPAAKK